MARNYTILELLLFIKKSKAISENSFISRPPSVHELIEMITI